MNIVKNILTKNDCYKSGKKITPQGLQLHTIGTSQNTATSLASYWNQSGISACVHYCIDAETEGKVLQFLPDNYRSWADAGYGNGNLITVELMESDYMKYTGGANYKITNQSKFEADLLRAYNTAVQFFAQKCKEYSWNPQEKMKNGLYRVSSHDEGRRLGLSSAHVDPTHVWSHIDKDMDKFRADVKAAMNGEEVTSSTVKTYYRIRKSWENAESQIGAYELISNAKSNCLPGYTVYDPDGNVVYANNATVTGTQYKDFANLTEKQAAAKILEMVREDYEKTGIFASVTAAQMILESGYVSTTLAQQGNNCFGMKCTLSGNTWANSTWDGISKVNIKTAEEYTPGVITYKYADFRKYPCIEDSIGDHSAYLLGAMDGNKKRYAGLTDCKNYKEAITLIKNGGYATDSSYISKICDIIERFGLDKYDKVPESKPVETKPVSTSSYYRVGTSWKNGKCQNQVGAYTVVDNAKNRADTVSKQNKTTYYVFDSNGATVYKAAYETVVFQPYNVKVSISDLRIRKTPNGAIVKKNGREVYTGVGVFGITEEKKTGGYTWGRLLSGAGWIALEHTKKVS